MTAAEWATLPRPALHGHPRRRARRARAVRASRPTTRRSSRTSGARRDVLNGALPKRTSDAPRDRAGARHAMWSEFQAGTGPKLTASTTTAFARLVRKLLADPNLGPRVVPIIPDEARTFGLDALFSDVKIYSPFGQTWEPVDAGLLLSYREARNGRVLEEGISEAGSMASFTAAGTAYATWSQPLVPFFIFYSMFGFQRIGDLDLVVRRPAGERVPARRDRRAAPRSPARDCSTATGRASCSRARCRTAGRYDPAFAYEVAVIIRDGLARMYGPEPEDCFYYLTLYNENVAMPAMPPGVEDGICRGLYRYREADGGAHHAQILASGMMMAGALDAQRVLAERYDVHADVWSATSYKLLREDAMDCERWNRLHPTELPRVPYVAQQLDERSGPVVAVTDYLSLVLGPDRALRADAVRVARDRRLRTLGHPRRAAAALRGRREPHRGDGAGAAGRDRARSTRASSATRSVTWRSIPRRLRPALTLGRSDRRRQAPRRLYSSSGSHGSLSLPSPSSSSRYTIPASSSSMSARLPPRSWNMPSSKPCLSSRASRKRRARPFLGTIHLPQWAGRPYNGR